MGISKDQLSRTLRAAIVSGLLGAAGFAIVAAPPVHAQATDDTDPGDTDPGDTDPGDTDPAGTTGGTTGGTTDSSATSTTVDVGATTGGTLPVTGGDGEMLLLVGAGATATAVVLRRFARRA